MAHNITLFADPFVAEALEEAALRGGRFSVCHKAVAYDDCLVPSLKNGAEVLILQVQSPVASVQDLMYDLQQENYNPVILLYEILSPGKLRYSTTDPAANGFAGVVSDFFLEALDGKYVCEYSRFRTAAWGTGDEDAAVCLEKLGRREALTEILRGCTDEEYKRLRRHYSLDLREKGYYLFFWELQYMEYREHRSNKDIYNFIGEVLVRECYEILERYNGGEVFYITLNQLCIIINELSGMSEVRKKNDFEEMIRKLGLSTGCKSATRYLSRRIADKDGLRGAYYDFHREKSSIFFLREEGIIRASVLETQKQSIDMGTIRSLLEEISSFLRFDVSNPKLTEALRHLYMDILKPSMNYTMYYFCTAVISSEIAQAKNSFEYDVFTQNLSPALMQYSSVEEQFEYLLGLLIDIRDQPVSRRQTRSALLLKAMQYIEANYRRDISVSDIAGAVFISSIYLSQIFKSETGLSAIQYLIRYRISQAKKLLAETDDMVYSISEQVGFRDWRHFSKTFTRMEGVSPREFRNLVRHKKKTGEKARGS